MAKWGYVGCFSEVGALPDPVKNAGNTATVGVPGSLVPYFSNGDQWTTFGTTASNTTYLRAVDFLSAAELAAVRASNGQGGDDLAPKIQAALDAAYLLTGSDQTGQGGHGVCMDFDPGTWVFSTLQLKPGMALRGIVDRMEVRFKQTDDAQVPLIDILGRGLNQDVIGRRTAVILERLDLNANGNVDINGDPIDCVHLRVDPDNEGDDDSANRTGLIATEISCGGASGWGIYNLKRGKMWLSKVQCTGNGKHPDLPNGKVGGLYSQGPDSFFHKTYCGSNGGIQLHIKSSQTPSIVEVELGVSKQPDLYPTLCIDKCTDAMIGGGGNCTGWIQVIGVEDDNTQDEYDTETRINFYDFEITLKDKSFQKEDTTFFTMDGAFYLENIRGVHMSNIRVKPASDKDINVHHYTNRPSYVVYIKGARTRATWHGPLPPLDDWNWPAGTPEQWPGSAPTNTYDSITNKPKQLRVITYDPTDTTGSVLFDRIKGVNGSLPISGPTEYDGGWYLSPTSVASSATIALDITKIRLDTSALATNTTVSFSGTPNNGTGFTWTVKASGGDRVVTLPADVVDAFTGSTISSFTCKSGVGNHIIFEYYFGSWKISGYPVRALIDKNYASDALAGAGGVAIGEDYHNAGAVRVRLT
jgi:hypothetical protein